MANRSNRLNRGKLAEALLAAGASPRELLDYVQDDSVAALLVQSASRDFLLELVQHRAIRRQIRRSHKLLYALVSWPTDRFQLLVDVLARLEPSLLEELELDSIRWRGFAEFSHLQRQVAFSLIEFHRKFPSALAEELRQGRVGDAWPVRLLAQYAPVEHRVEWLVEIWMAGRAEASEAALAALGNLGSAGYRALIPMLDHSELVLAQTALQRLKEWAPPQELVGIACRSELRSELADWLAAYLQMTCEETALALGLLPDVQSEFEAVARLLDRARPSRELLKLYAEQVHLRELILTWLRLWRPEGLADEVRGLPLDSRPRLVWLRLQLLHEIDRLQTEEIAQLDMLAQSATELSQEVAMLRLSYPAGPARGK